MKVTLVSHTLNPIEAIAMAAQNCYDSELNLKVLDHCYNSGHHSIFEFAQFHFHIEGISRACSHQLVRHRMASYCQRSQRYVDEKEFDYVTPKSLDKVKVKTDVPTVDDWQTVDLMYHEMVETIQEFYQSLINAGVPKEDARYILPNACMTTIDMSIDFRNMMHFCNERLCDKAQWEIRELAQQMKKEVATVAPGLERYLVPKCFKFGKCTEKNGCGMF